MIKSVVFPLTTEHVIVGCQPAQRTISPIPRPVI